MTAPTAEAKPRAWSIHVLAPAAFLLLGLGAAGHAAEHTVTITFTDPKVSSPGPPVNTLELEPPVPGGPVSAGPESPQAPPPGSGPPVARPRAPELLGRQQPSDPNPASRRAAKRPFPAAPREPSSQEAPEPPISAKAFATPVPPPGLGDANAHFVENGFSVEAFWAVNVGRADGHFIRGHFHPNDLASGYEAQHFGGSRELHGLFIRAVDGRPFGLKSLRYRVTRNRQLNRNASIVGFTNYNVSVLIATAVVSQGSVLGQFVAFPVGPPIGNDTTLPFQTLEIRGFDYVTQVFIASSASVDFDDIVLVPR